jgi:hypothetical protein
MEGTTSYPTIVDRIDAYLKGPPLENQSRLVVDGTGVGVPVVEMFRKAGLRPVPIWITGGSNITRKGQIIRVPKRHLVSVLQVLLQSQRLKFARGLPERDILINELLNFRVKITANANDTYEAWREGQHDDLVLGLSMACWYAERRNSKPQTRLSIEAISTQTSRQIDKSRSVRE